MHYRTPSKRQRVWSAVFWTLGLCAAICALAWPSVLQRVPHSRWVLGLLSLWCFALSGYLCGAWAAFADVIREDWFNDDDDDFHNGLTMRCSERRRAVAVAIAAPRGRRR